MFSFFTLFLSLLIILFQNKKGNDTYNKYDLYSLIFASLCLSQFFLGGISLFLITVGFAKFNTIFIALILLILTIICQKNCIKNICKYTIF